MILSNLEGRELVRLQGVNKFWQSAIQGSKPLRELTWKSSDRVLANESLHETVPWRVKCEEEIARLDHSSEGVDQETTRVLNLLRALFTFTDERLLDSMRLGACHGAGTGLILMHGAILRGSIGGIFVGQTGRLSRVLSATPAKPSFRTIQTTTQRGSA